MTIVEAVMATVILAFAVTAVAAALMAGAQQSYEAVDTRLANEAAQALMEEILTLPYEDPQGASTPGPEAGESTRSAYDNVDDYHGFAESAGALIDATGTAYPAEYAALSRSVTVTVTSLQPAGFGSPISGLTITVSVQLGPRTLAQVVRFVAAPAS